MNLRLRPFCLAAVLSVGRAEADKVLGYLEKWVDLLKLKELQSSVITVDGKRLIAFDQFEKAHLKFEFHEDRVEAHISIPPDMRKDQVLILHGLGIKVADDDLAKPADFSSFLNIFSSETYLNNIPMATNGLATVWHRIFRRIQCEVVCSGMERGLQGSDAG